MLKKFFKRFIPSPQAIRNQKAIQLFGKLLHDPNLWHLNRYSVSTAISIGCFTAFIPLPVQMLSASALAIILRANLPVSIALTWITNPLTIPPAYYFCYRLGSWLLGTSVGQFHFEASFEWFQKGWHGIALPLLTGCLVVGVLSAILGNIAVRLLWRYFLIKSWRARLAARLKRRRKGVTTPYDSYRKE